MYQFGDIIICNHTRKMEYNRGALALKFRYPFALISIY